MFQLNTANISAYGGVIVTQCTHCTHKSHTFRATHTGNMRKWHFKVSQTSWTPPIQPSVNATQPVQDLSLISSCNTLKLFLRWLHHETRALLKASLTMSAPGLPLSHGGLLSGSCPTAGCLYSNTGDIRSHECIHFFNVSISKCYVILLYGSIFYEHK